MHHFPYGNICLFLLLFSMAEIIKIHQYQLGLIQTNTYLLQCIDSGKAVIIDPAEKSEEIKKLIQKEGLELVYIINTHGHFDHIGGNAYFHAASGGKAAVAAHRKDFPLISSGGNSSFYGITINPSPPPEADAAELSFLEFGNIKLEILYTPGHTPGHISLYESVSSSLFCGDVLFYRSIGRTDLPGGSHETLLDSIRNKIFTLPENTAVYPGHGPMTGIKDEIRFNPWTQQQ